MGSAPVSEAQSALSALSAPSGVCLRPAVKTPVKLLVIGPFAVGRTTFADALSGIRPLRTEEVMNQAGTLVEYLIGRTSEGKHA
jgi:hypothetical protein